MTSKPPQLVYDVDGEERKPPQVFHKCLIKPFVSDRPLNNQLLNHGPSGILPQTLGDATGVQVLLVKSWRTEGL